MEKPVCELIESISQEEWGQVPDSVCKLIEELVRRIDNIEQNMAALRGENELLKEQVARTSANSSQPPSKNRLDFKPNRKEISGKKRGGQIGHIGHERKLYLVEMCQEVIDHYREKCSKCGSQVKESNSQIYRHQVVEVPAVKSIVIEHRFHQMTCTCCGKKNQALMMAEIISKGGYGSRVAAYIGLFSSQYRQSYRQIERIMQAVFGTPLLAQEKLLFNLWHQFRNEQLTRSQLIQSVKPIQAEFSSILLETAELHIDPQEKTPLAKTVRTCRNLLKLEVALWLFVSEDGVEPTNNAAERDIRPAVIWRRTSFGSDSLAGSESRLLTVVSSLNLQERNILDFLAESILAARSGQTPPSLLP